MEAILKISMVLNTGSINSTTESILLKNADGPRIPDVQSIPSSWSPGEKIFYTTSSLRVSAIASNKPLKVRMFCSGCSDNPSSSYITS